MTAWAEDTDVSARKVAPAKRPQLAKWLTEPQLGAWDILVCAKQDRLFRSVADIGAMTAWCVEHGKSWASVAENTDLSTPAGRMFANQLATFAEFEADRIGERCKESADRLAAAGRWRGGKPPYGYAPKDTGHGWTLILDDAQAGTAREMAKRAIGGASNGQIARWLNETGVATPRGGYSWTPEIVRVMLRSPSLAGWSTRNGKVVRDDDGNPVMITTTPVLDAETWHQLQAALDSRKQIHAERVGGHMLLGVAYCPQCVKPNGKPSPLYGHNAQGGSRMRSNYRCQSCGYSIRKEVIERFVEDCVMEAIGDRAMPRKLVIPAISHTAELATIDARIADIEREVTTGDMPAKAAGRILVTLEAMRDVLAAKPQREAKVIYEPTGQTVREHWATLDTEGRGRFLRTWGVRIERDRESSEIQMGTNLGGKEGWRQAFGVEAA